MKRLTLLRHAKSSWDDPVARDFDRSLNERGQRAAVRMGRFLRDQGLRFDAVIASPAVRVKETLAGVETGLGAALDARFDRRVYMASAATLLDIVQHAANAADRLLLVGHNPGLEDLAMLLTPDDGAPLRGELAVKYPTATLCEIGFDADDWRDIAEGDGTLLRFVRPRDLDASLGPDE